MLVFAFSSLWFAHYALAALQGLRAERELVRAATLRPAEVEVIEALPPALPPAERKPS